ncbi:MAG: HAD-IA family hydrolase [Deltaproteobacteria bacterium]|nr:HAD-IA family hydrolase [Deltaproteobacteria bacterium]
MDKEYTAVLFDLDGTLIDFRACESNSIRRALHSVGISLGESLKWEEFWQTYAPIKSRYWERRNRGEMTREEAILNSIRDSLAVLRLEESLARSVAKAYFRLFLNSNYAQPGAEETLRLLEGRFLLGLVSNGYKDAQRGRLEAAGLTQYFPTIIVSEEVGYEKPDPRIFQIALSEMRVTSCDTIYVGDSIEHDYKGALAAGIDFCHYDPSKLKPELDPEPVLRIGTLRELIDRI